MLYPEVYTREDLKEAESNGINYINFYNRVMVLNWDIERAKTQPIKKPTKKHGEYVKRAESNGISQSLFYHRVNRMGWSRERACAEPPMTKEEMARMRSKLFTGKSKYGEYMKRAKENGISGNTFNQRVLLGWTKEEACTVPAMSKSECAKYAFKKNFKKKYKRDYDECIKIAESNDITAGALNQRLRYGWDLETAMTKPLRFRKQKLKGVNGDVLSHG